jgi:PTS system nitrogen regulatory IIA component
VWTRLPSPTVLANELEHGEAELGWSDELETGATRVRHRLLDLPTDLEVRLEPDASVAMRKEADGALALLLERDASYLLRSLDERLVLELQTNSLETLLRELITHATSALGPLPVQRLVQDLLERERTFPASLGHGVAVPHVFVEGLDRQYCVLARLTGGLDWHAPDGEPVRLVLLLLSPPGDHDLHLALLADISRLLGSDGVRNRVLEAEPDRMLDVLRQSHAG